MTNGFGAMPDYAEQVPAADRWAIAAYIRALQLSQHATEADVPPGEQIARHAAAGRDHRAALRHAGRNHCAHPTPPQPQRLRPTEAKQKQ